MAQRTVVQLVDDLDGTELEDGHGETVTFSLDGTSYEIDLSADNAEKLRDTLSGYIGHARRVSSGAGKKRRGSDTAATPAEIRVWAREHGHDAPERGRIPAQLREAFEAAST